MDQLEAINLVDFVKKVPYAQLLGMTVDINKDGVTFILPFQDSLVGNVQIPALHGGVVGGFLESAAIGYLIWTRETADLPKTIDFSIDYLRSCRAKQTYATCTVARQGKRVAQVGVKAWQDDVNRPVAIGRGHFLINNQL